MLNIRPRETEWDGEREKKNNRNSIKAKTYSNKLIPVHWHWSEQFEHVYTLWKIKWIKEDMVLYRNFLKFVEFISCVWERTKPHRTHRILSTFQQ